MSVYTGALPDCDENSVNDLEDLVLGDGSDCTQNGILDSCDIDAADASEVFAEISRQVTEIADREEAALAMLR